METSHDDMGSSTACQSRWKPRTVQRSPTPISTRWRRWAERSTSVCCRRPRRTGCCAQRRRIDGKLHGFTFSTLERIGGTPCVLLGLMSVKRTSQARPGAEGPDGRGVPPGADGLPRRGRRRRLTLRRSPTRSRRSSRSTSSSPGPVTAPSARSGPGAAGWPSASASTPSYDEQSFVVKANGQSGFLDHETLKPEKIKPELAALFADGQPEEGRLA